LKKKQIFLFVVVLIFLAGCSKSENSIPATGNSADGLVKRFIPRETLEAVGVEHFGDNDFRLLFKCRSLYLLNTKDFIVVKFQHSEPQRVYKTARGQAPTEMIHPVTIFSINNDTIGIYDITRQCVLRYDLDLNYIDEVKLTNQYNYVYGSSRGVIAFLTFEDDNAFAFLDESFKPVELFVKANKTIPFDRFYPQLLNKRFMLSPDLVAHSYYLQPGKTCRIDIYDLSSRTGTVSLKWEQPFSPNQKDISSRKNLYFTLYAGQQDRYYVVQSSIVKRLGRKENYHFLVFDSKGKLFLEEKIPYRFVSAQSDFPDSKVYFLDENENIAAIDINELMEKKRSRR
jgi:hypothetical protein